MNNTPFIQPTYNFTVAKDLYNEWLKTNEPVYKASLSTVINYKLSTMSAVVYLTNQNLLNQISSITPQ